MAENKQSFSKQMRSATRSIHAISDQLVNAKLAFALHSNEVWAEGLLVFYEIFKYLENHISYDILPMEFRRTEAFEEDLKYYFGVNWKSNYQPRKEVLNYMQHLDEIKNTDPVLLIAYVYHLYMGLLSGGQILEKKRIIAKKLPFSNNKNIEGMAVTTFGKTRNLRNMKEKLRGIVDNLAEGWNDKIKQNLLLESKKVFELNNTIVGSVKGATILNLKLIGYIFLLLLTICFYFIMWHV